MLIHGLVSTHPVPKQVQNFGLQSRIFNWWCPCGWSVLVGVRPEADGTDVLLTILHFRDVFQRGWAVKLTADAPVHEMIESIGRKPCPGLHLISRHN